MSAIELIVGDPGSGKTGFMFYRCWQRLQLSKYRVAIVSTIEDPDEMKRYPPQGAIECQDLAEALKALEDARYGVIGYDEINLEVDEDSGKASPQLRYLGRYRRHLKVECFFTT